nr:immunoglobulin heavy chain junction region [Macaca mulatta]MOV89766.1 immunoglobulin heavy chain junction region [Macaca mulatta]
CARENVGATGNRVYYIDYW